MDIALPSAAVASPPKFAPLRIGITHLWRHHRLCNFSRPTRFNELVQHRKLHDRNLALPALADKLTVKPYVADRLGPEWLIPTLWHGTELPPTPPWPRAFVVKSRHGCNQTAFIRSDADNWAAVQRRSRRWMRRDYGFWLDEWLYTHIRAG